jgi:hypothetical protein
MASGFTLFGPLGDHAGNPAVLSYPGGGFRADPRYDAQCSLIVTGEITPNDRLVMRDTVAQVAQAIRFLVDKVTSDPNGDSWKGYAEIWRPDACLVACGEQSNPEAISQCGDHVTNRNTILAQPTDKRGQCRNEDAPEFIWQALLEAGAEGPSAAVNTRERSSNGIAEEYFVGLEWKIEGFG